MICIHIYIYLIEAMQSPRPCSSSSYYYYYHWPNSSTIMWSAAAVLVALTGALIAATGRAFVIVVPRQATFCPGYSISNVQSGNTGLTADLSLAGPACNSFGSDIPSLKLMVNYDTGMDFVFFFYLFTSWCCWMKMMMMVMIWLPVTNNDGFNSKTTPHQDSR